MGFMRKRYIQIVYTPSQNNGVLECADCNFILKNVDYSLLRFSICRTVHTRDICLKDNSPFNLIQYDS